MLWESDSIYKKLQNEATSVCPSHLSYVHEYCNLVRLTSSFTVLPHFSLLTAFLWLICLAPFILAPCGLSSSACTMSNSICTITSDRLNPFETTITREITTYSTTPISEGVEKPTVCKIPLYKLQLILFIVRIQYFVGDFSKLF